ncbi:hypothetical protein HYU09_01240 [Candidatus Woesearchaeota archaeon]|nr:hypothetical protein [Candidatus Woesearchaeota archaeon]
MGKVTIMYNTRRFGLAALVSALALAPGCASKPSDYIFSSPTTYSEEQIARDRERCEKLANEKENVYTPTYLITAVITHLGGNPKSQKFLDNKFEECMKSLGHEVRYLK